eukprot:scaffold2182_cov118-Isochrysis_galbana.AAC.4
MCPVISSSCEESCFEVRIPTRADALTSIVACIHSHMWTMIIAVGAFVAPVHRPTATSRHMPIVARLCTFTATTTVRSQPVDVVSMDAVHAWVVSDEAVGILFSAANRCERRSDGHYDVVTEIAFPGMIAESVNVIRVTPKSDHNLPSLYMDTLTTETRCSTGPAWVRRLLIDILDATKSTSNSSLTVEMNGNKATFVSEVALNIEMTLPRWLLIPTASLEKSGSASVQKLIDDQIATVIERFADEFMASAEQVSAK